MKFINHWKHSHCIIMGIQWGDGFNGTRTIEFTILNFGIEFKLKEPDPCDYDTLIEQRKEKL